MHKTQQQTIITKITPVPLLVNGWNNLQMTHIQSYYRIAPFDPRYVYKYQKPYVMRHITARNVTQLGAQREEYLTNNLIVILKAVFTPIYG